MAERLSCVRSRSPLDEHPFRPNPELGNFGIVLDSSPNRLEQMLMKRREALQAKGRPPRTLYAATSSLACRISADKASCVFADRVPIHFSATRIEPHR